MPAHVLMPRTLAIALVGGLLFAAAPPTPAVGHALAPPVLTIEPTEGPPGSRVAANVSGLEGCPRLGGDDVAPRAVVFDWDGEQIAGPVRVIEGAAAATFNVPTSAVPGRHELEAVCLGSSDVAASTRFTVTESTRLGLEPARGPPGVTVSVTATGFQHCGYDGSSREVVFLWDEEQHVAGPVRSSLQGSASARFVVPEDAPAGVHTVVARCAGDLAGRPNVRASTRFTVAPVVTGATEAAAATVIQAWQVVLAILLVLLLLAVLFTALMLRARRGARWTRMHIRVVEGAAAGPTAQPPVEFSPPSVAVRIEPRPDSGTHTVVEVVR